MVPTIGEVYAGRYRVLRRLGEGGMGTVFEALDTTLDRRIALKVVSPALVDRDAYRERFAREAALLARVRSRHIVHIHEYGQVEDTVYLTTELFPDGDLRNRLALRGALDRREALSVAAQLCEALGDAHDVGVVHRDVKPANVLLWERSGRLLAYLCDFGIAVDGSADGTGLTRTGGIVGSPAYMAPERHLGADADERGDLYSLGCVLWAALTGNAPYSGTDFQVITSHVQDAVPRLGTGTPLDERIDALLQRAMDKDPARRFASVQAMGEEVASILRDLDAGRLGPVPPAPGPPGGTGAGGVPTGTGTGTDGGGATRMVPGPVRPATPAPPPPAASSLPPAAPAAPSGAAESPSGDLADHGTVIRPGAAAAAAAGSGSSTTVPPTAPPVTPGAPSGAPGADDGAERGGRRSLLLVAVAVLALVLVGGLAALGLAGGEDGEPLADPDPSTSGSPTAAGSAEAGSPPAGARPVVAAEPAYRSVRFEVAVEVDGEPVEDVPLEVDTGAGWRSVQPGILAVPTTRGGERACAQVRVVGSAGDGVRRCARSQPPTVSLVREQRPCSRTIDGTVFPCTYYAVRVAGLAPGTTPRAEVLPVGARPWCEDPAIGPQFCRRVEIGPEGRGVIDRYFAILTDSGTARLRVDGVTSAPVRLFCGEPCA
ncbi:MAG: protein kinase [Actinobacteria bacterium]|nr:protein kinase [Actinomycetota bacterium]